VSQPTSQCCEKDQFEQIGPQANRSSPQPTSSSKSLQNPPERAAKKYFGGQKRLPNNRACSTSGSQRAIKAIRLRCNGKTCFVDLLH